MFSSRGTVRYEERGQGYRDVEKVGKHCTSVTAWANLLHHHSDVNSETQRKLSGVTARDDGLRNTGNW